MMLEPFAAVIAFLPLIAYLLFLAIVRVSGCVLVTTGGRDLAAVLLAVMGLAIIGPLELLFPKATAMLLGAWVWIPLVLLYFLFTSLFVLGNRPKLVVYGLTPEELFPVLVRAAKSLDPSALINEQKWQVELPAIGAHLRLDAASGYDCASILAFEPMLSVAFWDALLAAVRREVKDLPNRPLRRGWISLAAAVVLLFALVRYAVTQRELLVDGFREWLIR